MFYGLPLAYHKILRKLKMKRFYGILFLLIFAFSALLLISCSEGDEPSQNGQGNGTQGDSALVCRACGEGEYSENVTKEAGILTEGEKSFVCNACSDTYTEKIPATKSARILFIGDNSTLSEITYLDLILEDAGVEDRLISTLNHNHSAGATIDGQMKNIASQKTLYTLMNMQNGERKYVYSQSFSEGLSGGEWDFVIIGQAIKLGGQAESFSALSDYAAYIKENAKKDNVKLLWNMGWSLRGDSTAPEFSEYENDGAKMYAAIISAVSTFVEKCEDIDGIVPVGTAIENLKATPLGDTWTDASFSLGGESGDGGALAASLLIASEVLSLEISELDFMPLAKDKRSENIYIMAKEAAELAKQNKYEATSPECRSMKLLMIGNSYGNDAMAYFEKILHDAGYINVVIGHMGESSMAINDHYHNIDDDPTNDYIYKSSGTTFSVHHKTVNGVYVELEADYKKIVADEDWDVITFYQGPNSMATLTDESYYSELNNFCAALRANMTNPEGKIVYYMPWVHGEENTSGYYKKLSELTQKLFVGNELIDGIIPAGTVIQNLRTSYLNSSTDGKGDINRDWGHLNYGVGRYAVGLTFYAYLTGGDIHGISYIPTVEEARLPFTDPKENIEVIREAIGNALEAPFEITESAYKAKP